MENKDVTIFDIEDSEDTLSFRDLPIHEHNDNSLHKSPSTSSNQEPFEFFSDSIFPTKNIIFCGKTIPYESDATHEDELNEYQKRDYLTLTRSASVHRPYSYHDLNDDSDRFVTRNDNRSMSVRFSTSDTHNHPSKHSPRCESSSIQKVNITSLTSMSAKSKRRMFMFGPVKFKPEMELSAIRKRQNRRVPAPIFPALEGGEMTVTGDGSGGESQIGMARSLRCKPHLTSVLARSFGFGCIPLT